MTFYRVKRHSGASPKTGIVSWTCIRRQGTLPWHQRFMNQRTYRHRKVCWCGCGQRFRSARSDQLYKNNVHRTYAWRQRNKAAQARDRDEEQRRAAERRLRDEQAKASRAEGDRRAAHDRLIAEKTVLSPCVCGSEIWAIRADNVLSCATCANKRPSPVAIDYQSLKCPCISRGGKGLWYIDRYGQLECKVCHCRVGSGLRPAHSKVIRAY